MKTVYLYDELTGEYLREYIAQASPLQPGEFIAPTHSVDDAPVFIAGTYPVMHNGQWVNVPDHRGTVYYMPDGSQHVITELGVELPVGSSLTPPPPTIPVLKDEKALELKAACSAAIVAGKHCSALGSDYLYPTGKDDQSYLTARYSKAVALGDAGAPYKFMCADGDGVWARRDHTAAQIIMVALAVEGHVTEMLNKLDALMMQLSVASDAETIAGIIW